MRTCQTACGAHVGLCRFHLSVIKRMKVHQDTVLTWMLVCVCRGGAGSRLWWSTSACFCEEMVEVHVVSVPCLYTEPLFPSALSVAYCYRKTHTRAWSLGNSPGGSTDVKGRSKALGRVLLSDNSPWRQSDSSYCGDSPTPFTSLISRTLAAFLTLWCRYKPT